MQCEDLLIIFYIWFFVSWGRIEGRMRGMKKFGIENLKRKKWERKEIIASMYLYVGEEGKGERRKKPSRNKDK